MSEHHRLNRVRTFRHAVLYGAVIFPLSHSPLSAQDAEGTWAGRFDAESASAHLQLSADWDRRGQNNIHLRLSGQEETEVVRAALDGDGFFSWSVERAAGTIELEGRIRNGRGSGLFSFEETPGFRDRMAELGFRDMDVEEVFSAAALDVGPDRVAELQSMGFARLTLDDVFAASIFDVDSEFQASMRSAGFEGVSLDDLVAFRVHDIDAGYVAQARAMGLGILDRDDIMAMKIHGVDSETLRVAESAGFEDVDMDDLLSMRIHSVTGSFLADMADEGYPPVDLEQALAFRIHGVTPEWVHELREMGYDDLTAEDLVNMRIHGLDRILSKRRVPR